jgi:hypothetical protein
MIMDWLYKNWSKLCLGGAVILTLLIFIFIKPSNTLLFLIWIQIPIYLLHQFEEHSRNGFKHYVNQTVFKVSNEDYPLNDKNIFWINIPIIWILMPLFAILSGINPLIGLWIPFFGVINSLSHVIFSIVNKQYNPGIIVSLVLGIPVGLYALVIFYSSLKISYLITGLAVGFAIILHLIVLLYIRNNYKKNPIKKP